MSQEENDIQRFLQVREDIYEEIRKIEPSVTQLKDTTNKFVAHFDVFQSLSHDAQEHIKTTIKGAAQDMAETVAEALSGKVQSQIQETIENLSQSVEDARWVLESTIKTKTKKLILIACMASLLSTVTGFGLGYFYTQKTTYALSPGILEIYHIGSLLRKAWPTMTDKEKQLVAKLMTKKEEAPMRKVR